MPQIPVVPSVDEIKRMRFDHMTPVFHLDPEMMLYELLYLVYGFADEQDIKGVRVALSPHLIERRQQLFNRVLSSIRFSKRKIDALEKGVLQTLVDGFDSDSTAPDQAEEVRGGPGDLMGAGHA